ncbi:MAG: FtsX-like permease family protein [Candidatus Bathyarchaeota archaeon]|jgi:ABC-type antimicrobial peptide transport system permease subunit|nr:ABC transporter permease [Candidatus Bathyarchaeota archaeon A05DMB-3]MDH7607132.1 FtsX-like permease family protein [Candidatus Bathyarchaeota archaeon]
MFSYAIKRVLRSFGLFAALLLGVVLASSFFAGINVGADTTAKAALLQQLKNIPVDITVSSYSTLRSSDWENATSAIEKIDGIVRVEVISRANLRESIDGNYTAITVTAISNTSKVYNGLSVVEGANFLGVNETYVWIGSKTASKVKLGDTITLNFTYYSYTGPWEPEEKTLAVLPLKVVGFAELDDSAYSIATGEWGTPVMILQEEPKPSTFYGDLLLIASWEKTFAKLLDSIPQDLPYYNIPFSTQILAYIDRDRLINPWDVQSSITAVNELASRVKNEVAGYDVYVNNNLGMPLMVYQFTSIAMRFAFIGVALPVFFVAWYVGTTVSDVSYNLRRREVGLLLTKGFSNSQIFRLFLTESIMIGIVGGLAGVALGFLLGPFFTTASEGLEGVTPVLSMEVIIITVIFGLAITLLSTFRPSRRAAKLPAVEALREYTYIEEVKPYKQRGPWIAFILGLYKIIVFLLGIDLTRVFARPPFINIFLLILLGIWLIIDSVLTYIGPLLFFWGFTKIFIRGSLKFQELVARAAKFLGDLGALATKNVQRNPARATSIAFLVALIVGYSFQTIGWVASSEDYTIRQIKTDVGADISASLSPTANITHVLNTIKNMTETASATIQYSISGSFPGDPYSRQIVAVDPENWLSTAYYEDDWFSGNNAAAAFQLMEANNRTIILERSVASRLNKKVGDAVAVTIESSTLQLEVVGFFGRESPQEYPQQTFRSYIPTKLYKTLNLGWYSSATVLVKLKAGADGKNVAFEIRDFEGVSSVRSVAEELEKRQSNLLLVGPLNIQRLGVVFAILAASVAVGLATLVSLQERKKEASIMSARGLSFKQLVIMLLTENMAVVTFAVVLGAIVGLIVVHGNVAASNSALTYTLVTYRMVFPLDAITLLASCLILIFASTIIPTLLLTKRYILKVERIVRL